MTHDELLAILNAKSASNEVQALRAVVELHKPYINYKGQECFCKWCGETYEYPCPTIQAIEKELK